YHVELSPSDSIEAGLGFGFYVAQGTDDDTNENAVTPSLSPSVRYFRWGNGGFEWGAGLRTGIALIHSCAITDGGIGLIACSRRSPFFVVGEVFIGYAD